MHYFQFHNRGKMGIKDENENCIIPAKYDHIELNSDGLFNVQKEGRIAYFDLTGKIFLPFSDEFETYGNFSEGLARIKTKEGKWGFINKQGTLAIQPSFHFAEDFSNGMAVVRNEKDLHGAIDKSGQLIIEHQFKVLTNFDNGYACFGDAATWGLIDKYGNTILPQDYVFIDKVKDGKVRVQVQEGEDYKEGIYTIGGDVEWNNNLDQFNAYNRMYRQFSTELQALIQSYYQEGCPCEYQRFRDFISWKQSNRFVDQELLWSIFNETLDKKTDHTYQCKKCSTEYMQNWEQYSAFLWVLNVTIQGEGIFQEKGAAVLKQVPVVLGFQGYNLAGLNEKYLQTDIATTIAYLKEKK